MFNGALAGEVDASWKKTERLCTASALSVDICVSTYRRANGLRMLLDSLERQLVDPDVNLRLIVADNDTYPSAKCIIEQYAGHFPWPIIYIHAPSRNISTARNATLAYAQADWVAFIDDDEIAPVNWISELLFQCRQRGLDGAVAPSLALYDSGIPAGWGRINAHSNFPVKFAGKEVQGHTSNAIIRYRNTQWSGVRFNPDRGVSGGEDTEYFAQIQNLGAKLTILETPMVSETVTYERANRHWLIRRRFRSGQTYLDVYASRLRQPVTIWASLKAIACFVMAALFSWSKQHSLSWVLRGALHCGVFVASVRSFTLKWQRKGIS